MVMIVHLVAGVEVIDPFTIDTIIITHYHSSCLFGCVVVSFRYPDCCWEGDSILVLHQVRIDPPYNRQSLHTVDSSAKPDFIDRVIKQVSSKSVGLL